ncbi:MULTISPECIES: carboxyl transferase domain-containing protein [Pseudonocardia]|uniref:Acetyl-coenzyme A carboxylase carboxyl transferase subunit beta n=2 Tax=Pseudonocardia TaxID=1847 RepID=A0A1Y2N4W4_PSEAH|nr:MULTISPECIES: carboxyl transferase domain-containing protein [Pseudonocardia]OSY42117.1 Acetyl-coenzyme A carboxylase carboxyl transferase subunit beta [Pseudonocardia autotrophica]TDN75115.1 acetyl-CoA carboxylase carboxyl transferase subunit beta [Pseudonocardia autotrophica]BBF99060.1 acetyl-CoA carboxylase carboxyltransferase subunit beta [Pseudonocardia autotrophica]GEC23980.1 acetyl-CoA carboxylase carboxyltransferase subunit beta [Pseudonocardia saturnea]
MPPEPVPQLRPGLGTPGSTALLTALLDPGSFHPWDSPAVPPSGAGAVYRRELAEATRTAGTDESVVTGGGRIFGHAVAVVCSEFGFLAGSVGTVAARRVIDAVARATAEELPLVLAPASGGTRMQEGNAAFLAMIEIAGRIAVHREAGLPVIGYLRHPTTGGAFASWGSLGSVVLAEPGALIGFLGPKVYRALHGEPFPPGVQTAENLHAHGLVDAVVDQGGLRDRVAAILRTIGRSSGSRTRLEPAPEPTGPPPGAWEAITATRSPGRPGVRELLEHGCRDVVELHGTGAGEVAAATVLCLARLGDTGCVLVGQDRAATRAPGPADLRVAQRGMELARELRLPLVTVIDTPGGELSPAAENGGLAGEIARCLAAMTRLPVPTVSVLLGRGTGGIALALLPADRVLAAGHGWLTPLPPEGASAIVHGTPDRAAEVAATQQVTASDLAGLGAIDRIVAELPDAADEPVRFVRRIAGTIEGEIAVARTVQGLRRTRCGENPPT